MIGAMWRRWTAQPVRWGVVRRWLPVNTSPSARQGHTAGSFLHLALGGARPGPGMTSQVAGPGYGRAPVRSLSLVASEGRVTGSTVDPKQSATLENTYIMGIEADDLDGQPEMVRRVFMLLNGRRTDLTKAQKQWALERHRRFVDDTGSPEVQAAVLSTRIRAMSAHLTANKKDSNCKRILTRVLHRRRKVLQYLYRLSPKRYAAVSAHLGLFVPTVSESTANWVVFPLQALADLGLRTTVAPPPQPTYNMKHDIFKTQPGKETKRQRKKRGKFEKKIARHEERKANN